MSPIALTGYECAHNSDCGLAPGYDKKKSITRNSSFVSNTTNFKMKNTYIPGVNDRVFDGEFMQDQICPQSEISRQKCVSMKFFKINKILEGDVFSANGRLGLDYDAATDADLPSYLSILRQTGII